MGSGAGARFLDALFRAVTMYCTHGWLTPYHVVMYGAHDDLARAVPMPTFTFAVAQARRHAPCCTARRRATYSRERGIGAAREDATLLPAIALLLKTNNWDRVCGYVTMS